MTVWWCRALYSGTEKIGCGHGERSTHSEEAAALGSRPPRSFRQDKLSQEPLMDQDPVLPVQDFDFSNPQFPHLQNGHSKANLGVHEVCMGWQRKVNFENSMSAADINEPEGISPCQAHTEVVAGDSQTFSLQSSCFPCCWCNLPPPRPVWSAGLHESMLRRCCTTWSRDEPWFYV